MSTISGLISGQGSPMSMYTTRTGAPIWGAAIPRPPPNLACQSRRVSRMSSRMTRTAVDRGRVIVSQRGRRNGSPSRRMRWIVIDEAAQGEGQKRWLNMHVVKKASQLHIGSSILYYYKVLLCLARQSH